jgi:D-glycero-alpha-D-manno-heptose 1-phosphate guanylyltransferase
MNIPSQINTVMPEAIILAGGLGTRLKSEVPDLPKCMAPVAGKPFIDYVIKYLIEQGVNGFIFSLGYKHDVVINHLESTWPNIKYEVAIEKNPLGTGGGIRFASKKVKSKSFFVLNGDTYFDVDLLSMFKNHESNNAQITVALKQMVNFDRYGSVLINQANQICAFREKTSVDSGLINGGIYLIKKSLIEEISVEDPFSFEKNFIYGFVSDGYFIDIGITEDFKKANADFNK